MLTKISSGFSNVLIVVVIALILGVLAIFAYQNYGGNNLFNSGVEKVDNVINSVEGDSLLDELNSQSDSDEIDSIESDLNDTDLDSLDDELGEVESDLNSL